MKHAELSPDKGNILTDTALTQLLSTHTFLLFTEAEKGTASCLEFDARSLEFHAWSLEFNAWSLEFDAWSLECGVWSLTLG